MLSHRANQALMGACYGVIKHCLVIAHQSTSETLQKYNVVPLPPDKPAHLPALAVLAPEPFSARNDYNTTGFFFPGRPMHSRIKNCILSKAEEKEPPCNKDYKEAGKYGAGMALFWCGRHRECIGWILLQKSESLEIIYAALVTRFVKLPTYLIYDNACNLYEYCANRAPNLFVDTVFLSDGFH